MRFHMFSSAFLILLLFSSLDLGINFTIVLGQSEKHLLLELKNNLTYDSSVSTKLVHWNDSSSDSCHWPGVKCDAKSRVSSLDLSRESISAGINGANSSLFKLVYLQSLNLAENSFDSTELPFGFGKLTELRYLNLSNSGFSGQVPSDFSDLTRLVVLDLSNTIYTGPELSNPDLRRLIHNFTRLRELYLDGVNISANGNEWSSAISSSLPNLSVLSLSNSYLTGTPDSSLLKLQSLSVIRLDRNTFSSPFPSFFADFPNLRVFTISSSDLSGVAPKKLFQITSLQTIDLSNNRELEGSFPEFPVNGSLQKLLLQYTKFSGTIPESIGNLRMLTDVDVRSCSFSGPIPSSIKNLKHLSYLDLSLNNFSGSIPSFASLKSVSVINLHANRLTGQIHDSLWEGLDSLNFLDLSENLLQGKVPESLFVLPLLKVLYISNNSFSGSISVSTTASSSLEVLELSVNHLQGPIPEFIFGLQNLSSLSLSSNNFSGSLKITDFRKLTDLASLDLSYNDLYIHVDEDVPISSLFPRLGSLRLASCKMEKVPFLKNQSSLMMLDLSNNQLGGEIPNWIWQVGNGFLRYLNLSHNQFTHLQQPYDLRSLDLLDLHSNMLGGEIPLPLPSSAVFVDFSSNNFTSSLPPNIGNSLRPATFFSIADNRLVGTIPSSLCNASRLQILDLSNNSFHGRIPPCLLEITLSVLSLKRNNLDGDIPDSFPVGCRLETLDLSWNVLQGKVPKSLTRCTEIEVLNLGNNALNDTFPCWLKNLSRLRVLVLRFNHFHGNIDCLGDSKTWPNLQIISFASNNINGAIPANMFRSMKALIVDEDGAQQQLEHLHFSQSYNNIYYQDSVTVILKGQELELKKILTIFTSIDFSDNHLGGSIPQTLGELKSLYFLNLSHNALSGHIPSSIGNLQKLESLDLSFNGLDGEIPRQLASLTFLSFLNVSYNHLVGRIPHGSQIQTFPESSFIGNEGLCGFPLNKTCNDTGTSSSPVLPQGKLEREIYVSAALGFLVGLGFIFGPLILCKRWRRCYNKCLIRIIYLVIHQQDRRLENVDW